MQTVTDNVKRPGTGLTKKEYDAAMKEEWDAQAKAAGAPHYPKCLYRWNGSEAEPKIVKNPDEHAEVCPESEGWCENPGVAKAWAQKVSDDGLEEDPEDQPNPDDPYYGFNQPQVLEAVLVAKQTLQVNLLKSMRAKEVEHPKKTIKGGRAKVLKAIDGALEELERVRASN